MDYNFVKLQMQLADIANRNRDMSREGRINALTLSAGIVFDNLCALVNEIHSNGSHSFSNYYSEKLEKLKSGVNDLENVLNLLKEDKDV